VRDLDNDGDNDVLASIVDENAICWWSNEGGEPLVWNLHYIDTDLTGSIYVYAKDIDGDEILDVLGAGWNGNEIAWWRNDGYDPINWTKQTVADDFHGAHEVFAFDIDDDENMDILGASALDDEIAWWKNDGGNPIQWTKQTIDSNFAGARSVDAADINNDGFYDIVGAALDDNEIAWWENNGEEPIVWTKYSITTEFNLAHKVYICDFNGDNFPDILGTGYGNVIFWWENDGNDPVGWIEHQITNSFGGAVIAYADDLDQDNDLDVFGTAQGSNQVTWWENDGVYPFEWTEYQIDVNFTDVWGLHFGDLDGDEDTDVVAGGRLQNQICWYENSFHSVQFSANPITGHIPLEVQFTDESNFQEPILTWFWDFDNDGSFESNEQHPTYVYDEPGVYSVSLMIMTELFSKTVVYEDYISVFNGESALEFNGDESYANCPSSESLNLTNEITLEAWIKPTSYGSVPNLGFGRIFDKEKFTFYLVGESPSFNNHSLVFEYRNENDEIFRCNTPENSISLDSWQHVAVTYDSIEEVKMFIQGAAQTLSNSGNPNGNIDDNTDFDLFMGNSQNLNWSFEGLIDEVRCWNTVRSGTDIQMMMLYHLSGNEAGLVGCWEMNEGNGEILNDLSSLENTANISNANWVQGIELIPVAVEEENIIDQQNAIFLNSYPNPFKSSTTISFNLTTEQTENTEILIYNLKGQKVKSLPVILSRVEGTINWDGKDESGKQVNSGIYFYHLTVDDKPTITKRMILIK